MRNVTGRHAIRRVPDRTTAKATIRSSPRYRVDGLILGSTLASPAFSGHLSSAVRRARYANTRSRRMGELTGQIGGPPRGSIRARWRRFCRSTAGLGRSKNAELTRCQSSSPSPADRLPSGIPDPASFVRAYSARCHPCFRHRTATLPFRTVSVPALSREPIPISHFPPGRLSSCRVPRLQGDRRSADLQLGRPCPGAFWANQRPLLRLFCLSYCTKICTAGIHAGWGAKELQLTRDVDIQTLSLPFFLRGPPSTF